MISTLYAKVAYEVGGRDSYISIYSDGIRFLNFNETLFIPYNLIIDHTFNGSDQIEVKLSDRILHIKTDSPNSKYVLGNIDTYIKLCRIRYNVVDAKSNYITSVHLSEDRSYYSFDNSYDIFTDQVRVYNGVEQTNVVLFNNIQNIKDIYLSYKPALEITHDNQIIQICTSKVYLDFIKELLKDYQNQ